MGGGLRLQRVRQRQATKDLFSSGHAATRKFVVALSHGAAPPG